MKNKLMIFVLILLPLLALAGLFWFLHVKHQLPTEITNTLKAPLEFKDNTVQCPQCHMFIVGKRHTAQIITNDLKTHFFDDVGCAILWLKDQKIEPQSITFWAYSNDSNRYINALNAFYSIDDATPMLYGFGAYEKHNESMIDFSEMRLRMLRGENMSDSKVKHHLQGH